MTMQIIRISVSNPDELLGAGVLGAGAKIRLERSATGGGSGFSEITTIALVAGTYAYAYYDSTGSSTSWYRARYSNTGNTVQTDYSAEFRSASSTATSLATLRGMLNADIGVTDDAETSPYSAALRNRAISQAYADLWVRGVWKPVEVVASTVDDQTKYTVSGIRVLERAQLQDSDGAVVAELPSATLRQEGTGWVLYVAGLPAGYTIHAFGWTAYKSTFSGDGDVDDIDPEWTYVPLLKARSICFRTMEAKYQRYGARQTVPPDLSVTLSDLVSGRQVAEREYADACKTLAALRPRVGRRLAAFRGI
jgi:hypothetical protein